jgi:uncharacterized protein DUF6508
MNGVERTRMAKWEAFVGDGGGSGVRDGDPDDASLLAQLDTSAGKSDCWRRLLRVADDFAAVAHRDDDSRVVPAGENADGSFSAGYFDYGARVVETIDVLYGVGAVTPAFNWSQHPETRALGSGSQLSPADAVRLATSLVRGERFCDGVLGDAVDRGALQAAVASLAAWYRAARPLLG